MLEVQLEACTTLLATVIFRAIDFRLSMERSNPTRQLFLFSIDQKLTFTNHINNQYVEIFQ